MTLVVFAMTFTGIARADDRYQLSATGTFGPEYVPGAWTPVRVTFSNDSWTDNNASIVATVEGPDGKYQISSDVWVPSHSRVVKTAFVPLNLTRLPVARGKGTPSQLVEWRQAGATMAQSEVLLNSPIKDSDGAKRSAILSFYSDIVDLGDSSDPSSIRKAMTSFTGWPIVSQMADIEEAPRNVIAYDGCRVVILCQTPTRSFDALQQSAMLDFVRSGGTLVVSAPVGGADVRGTWLEDYLPVRVIGERQATSIKTSAGDVKLRALDMIAEAVPRDGARVMLADEDYVHIAWRSVGLGRVVFMSFPITSPVWQDAKVGPVWTDLTGWGTPDPSWASTRFASQQRNVLSEMIGKPAPPRGIAVGIALGFVALVFLSQLVWRGAGRPVAFAVGAVVAVLGSVVLIGMTYTAQRGATLTAGRVSVTRLGDGGGGLTQELAAFTGNATDLDLSTPSPNVSLTPIAYDAASPPLLKVTPFSSPNAGAAAGHIDRLWEGQSAASPKLAVSATGMFGPDGLQLTFDNATEKTIDSPLLTFGEVVYRLGAIPPAASKATITGEMRNPTAEVTEGSGAVDLVARARQFINTGAILSDDDKLRGFILATLSISSDPTLAAVDSDRDSADTDKSGDVSKSRRAAPRSELRVYGWLNGVDPLIVPSAKPQVERSLNLISFPLTLKPSVPGTVVKIDAGFNTQINGPSALPIFDTKTGTWLASSQPGEWLLGLRPPPEVGRITPTSATFHADVTLPAHTMTIRHGQVAGGQLSRNPAGPELATYSKTFGAQSEVTFEIAPNDVDSDGILWLSISVDIPTPVVGQLWRINQFGVDLTGRVGN